MAHKEAASSKEIYYESTFRERYDLLKRGIPRGIKIPPFEAFIKHSLPYRIKDSNETVYAHALGLKREWSQWFWNSKPEKLGLTEEDRKDFQIVVIPPSRQKNGDRDFSKKLHADLKKSQLGKNPVAKLIRGQRYANDPYESRHEIENFKSARSVYIVASPLSKGDYGDIKFVAEQYLMNGAKEIILVAPFMADQRDDKNVKKTKDGEPPEYNGRILKFKAWMRSLSPFVSRIINFEPHSAAAQAFAALYGIPMAPISYEEELLGQIKDRLRDTRIRKFDASKWKVVRPDYGRNIVATRVEERFGIEGVHLEQVRNSDTLVKRANKILPELKAKLKGTNVILYDDEAGTFGTIKNVVKQLVPAGVRSINIFLGHARLQQGWTGKLNWIVEKCRKKGVTVHVYVTDSRVPVGSLRDFMAKESNKGIVRTVSIGEKIKRVIKANVEGRDLFTENNYEGVDYERGILQFTKEERKRQGEE